jgi:hypothetical protein
MAIIKILLWGLAFAWVVGALIDTRHQWLHGGIVSPPMFASTVLFGLGLIGLLILGASAWHLLWWFPLSAALGILLMPFPWWLNFTMACLSLLVGPRLVKGHSTNDD